MKNKNYLIKLREYIIVTIGVAIIAFGLQSFYLPNSIAAGGLTGMALVVNNYIPAFSVPSITFICNGILLIGAFAIIDKDFGFKTIYATFVLTTSMNIIDSLLGGQPLLDNVFISVIIGAIVMAIGLSLLIMNNASTGGTEILAKILNKYSTINIAMALLFIDLLVTVCAGITFGIEKGIFSIMAVMLIGANLNFIMKVKDSNNTNSNVLESLVLNEELEEVVQYASIN